MHCRDCPAIQSENRRSISTRQDCSNNICPNNYSPPWFALAKPCWNQRRGSLKPSFQASRTGCRRGVQGFFLRRAIRPRTIRQEGGGPSKTVEREVLFSRKDSSGTAVGFEAPVQWCDPPPLSGELAMLPSIEHFARNANCPCCRFSMHAIQALRAEWLPPSNELVTSPPLMRECTSLRPSIRNA